MSDTSIECFKKYYHSAPLTWKRSNGILASRDMITLCDMEKYHPSSNELTSTEQWGGVHNKYITPAKICTPLIVSRSPTKSMSILPSLHLWIPYSMKVYSLLSVHIWIPYPMKVYSLKCALVNPLANESLLSLKCALVNPLPNESLLSLKCALVNPLTNESLLSLKCAHVNPLPYESLP